MQLLVGSVLLGALAGCDEPGIDVGDLPDERVWTSEHFRYLSRADDSEVCEPIIDTLEKHFDALQRYLGTPWPAGKRIDYFKFRDADDIVENGPCSSLNASCFFAEVGVHSASAFEQHELIHAYVAAYGDKHRLLEEGMANALSCGHTVRDKPEPVGLREAFSAEAWRTNTREGFHALYDSASWFVAWLLNEAGPESFMKWFVASSPSFGLDEMSASFERIYGSDLQIAWLNAFASRKPDVGCVRIYECESPNWYEQAPKPACENPGHVRTLDLERQSWLVHHTGGFGSMLGQCPTGEPLPHHDWLTPAGDGQRGEVFAYLLPTGRYFVSESPRFGPIKLHLFKADTPPDSCEATIPLPADFDSNLTVSVMDGAESPAAGHWLRWTSSETQAGAGYDVSCSGRLGADWCADCSNCTAACDTIVVAESSRGGTLDTLNLTSRSAAGGWVRLTRTH